MKIPIIALLLLCCSGHSWADYYQAPLQEANWEVTRTQSACFLRQAIDTYGVAEFVQSVGGPLRFSLQEQRHKSMVVKASLRVMSAPWIHEAANAVDQQVYLDSSTDIGGYTRLSSYAQVAETMIDALLQGQFPTFIYYRQAKPFNMEETRVAVSAIHFKERYNDFADCRNTLHSVVADIKDVDTRAKKKVSARKKQVQSKPTSSAANASETNSKSSPKKG